jgi:hypothetical protein
MIDYDYQSHRTVVLLSDDLATGIALNVVGHLAISIGAAVDNKEMIGRSILVDASGVAHRGISRYAIIIKQAKRSQVRRAIEDARSLTTLMAADYPQQMAATAHDNELALALGLVAESSLDYLGAIFYGPTPDVDSVCRKYSLWRK